MAAILLDGEALAAQERAELAKRVADLQGRSGSPPGSGRSSSATTARAPDTWR